MDINRKKELVSQWKNRHSEMGILSMRCKATGDVFLGISKDTRVGFNRHRFQLPAKMHPNKALQALWDEYGENGFEYYVAKTLKYDDPTEDQTEKLEELLEECLSETPQAHRL